MNGKFITTYEELLDWRRPALRDRLRHLALDALVLKNKMAGAGNRYLSKPRIQFLYIHHVFKDEERKLQELLKRLQQEHSFISYSDAVSKILTGSIDKPYISFSSDDGLKNNLAAAEILNTYNAKACFFINPSLVGETDYNKIKAHCLDVLDFPVVEFLNWDEVNRLQDMGHEIGGHTLAHMNMAKTPVAQIKEDLAKTKGILEKHCGSVRHFAFPYGRFFHFSEAARKEVFDAGFFSCATAERGCHINPPLPLKNTELCIRRDQVILHWPLEHIMYFIATNAKNAHINNNLFPPLQ